MEWDWDDRTKAILLLFAIIGSIVVFYLVNNVYETWALTANPVLALFAYYFLTQPIYDLFIGIFTYEIYKEDESFESALKGFVGAIMITVGLDLTGLPFAFESILTPNGTIVLQPNTGTSPYADFVLANWMANAFNQGIVNLGIDLAVHLILPIIFVVGALAIVRWNMFVALVERS